jgi:3-methyladenine DNA glycosylase Mpg
MMPDADVVVLPATVALPFEVVTTPRIGITKAADWPLRFVVKGNPHVSGRGGRNRVRV